jgi:hypothetical protein
MMMNRHKGTAGQEKSIVVKLAQLPCKSRSHLQKRSARIKMVLGARNVFAFISKRTTETFTYQQ